MAYSPDPISDESSKKAYLENRSRFIDSLPPILPSTIFREWWDAALLASLAYDHGGSRFGFEPHDWPMIIMGKLVESPDISRIFTTHLAAWRAEFDHQPPGSHEFNLWLQPVTAKPRPRFDAIRPPLEALAWAPTPEHRSEGETLAALGQRFTLTLLSNSPADGLSLYTRPPVLSTLVEVYFRPALPRHVDTALVDALAPFRQSSTQDISWDDFQRALTSLSSSLLNPPQPKSIAAVAISPPSSTPNHQAKGSSFKPCFHCSAKRAILKAAGKSHASAIRHSADVCRQLQRLSVQDLESFSASVHLESPRHTATGSGSPSRQPLTGTPPTPSADSGPLERLA